MGVGYLPLLVLPWTFGALVSTAGYSESRAGWIASAEIGCMAVTSLLAARRAAARDRRYLAAGGMLLAVLANAVAMIAPPVSTTFIGARVFSGAGCGIAVAVGNATAAGSKNPTRTFAVLWFLMALWQLAVFNATPWLIGRAGLAGTYGLIAAVCLCYLPLGLRVLDPKPVPENEPKASGGVLRNIQTAAILMAFLCFWLRDALVYTVSERLALAAGIDDQRLGALLGIASVAGLVGPTLAARLKTGAPPPRLLGASLLLALGVSAAQAISRSQLLFSAAVLLTPATTFFAVAVLSGLAARIDANGRVVAIGASLGFLSEGIGPALAGSLMEFRGRGIYAAVVIGVSAVTLFSALIATMALRRTHTATLFADSRPVD
jgi:predicted MFS family arabinose efflux permease